MTTPEFPELDVRTLGPLRKIGSGAQGQVFQLVNDPEGHVYKEYSPRVVDELDVAALRRFVAFGRGLDDARRTALLARTAWPEAIVRRDGVVRGFVMRKVPTEFVVPMSFGDEVTDELARVQFLLNPPTYLKARGLAVDIRFRLEFLYDTAVSLQLFHDLGISVGDLSPNNMMFSPTARPRCFFIDCDAMRLGGDCVLEQLETPDWQVGAIGDEELGTAASDVYKFGLLAIRLFAGDQQTRNPHVVPSTLRPLVTRALSVRPTDRPAANKWLRQLDKQIPAQRPPRAQRTRPQRAPRPKRPPNIQPLQAKPNTLASIGGATAAVAGVAIFIGMIIGAIDNTPSSRPPLGTNFRVPQPTTYYNPYPVYPNYTYQIPTIPRITLPPLATIAPPVVPIQPVP